MELNPRDYRAWYGLGQTYEMLHMPYYALHYFRRATQLRPKDARMWCVLAGCWEAVLAAPLAGPGHCQQGDHAMRIRCLPPTPAAAEAKVPGLQVCNGPVLRARADQVQGRCDTLLQARSGQRRQGR